MTLFYHLKIGFTTITPVPPCRSLPTKALNNLKFTYPSPVYKQIIRIFVNPFFGDLLI